MNQSTEYLFDSLEGSQSNLRALFAEYKRPTEDLYLGLVDPKYLHFTSISEIYDYIDAYFKKVFDKPINISAIEFRNFIKLCWLSEVYLTEGIRNPLGVHYNPRIKKNVIHPGSIRQAVYHLFHSGPINVIYFNTGGVQFPWLENMQKIELSDIDCHVALIPDHGSLIPHLNYEQHLINNNLLKYHSQIKQRFSTDFTIRTNVSINALQRWETSLTPTVELIFKDNYDIKDVVQAVILIALGYSYESEKFTISF